LGPKARSDPLSYFFKHLIEEKGLLDLDPIKLKSNLEEKRVGEDRVAKRIDWFLVI
jgi:hypothetical protein